MDTETWEERKRRAGAGKACSSVSLHQGCTLQGTNCLLFISMFPEVTTGHSTQMVYNTALLIDVWMMDRRMDRWMDSSMEERRGWVVGRLAGRMDGSMEGWWDV